MCSSQEQLFLILGESRAPPSDFLKNNICLISDSPQWIYNLLYCVNECISKTSVKKKKKTLRKRKKCKVTNMHLVMSHGYFADEAL